MLQRTFLHVPGLGAHTEKSLWKQGCHSWEAYLDDPNAFSIGGCSREKLASALLESQQAVASQNHQYFSQALGQREAWRAWPVFQKRCLYLDIETDGGSGEQAITCVGLYDGKVFRCLVKDQDLYHFPDIISHYSMIVTFFGSGFDIPVLKQAFSAFHFDQIHIDLHPTLRRLGYRGGLKKIERQLGIERSSETSGLTGRDAIWLWRNYLRGDERALETLIAYNREDVVNLETLLQHAYAKLERQTLVEAGVAHILEGQASLF